MDTMAPGSNGIGNVTSAQRAAGNLTYEQKVVRGHDGLDSLPGHVLVVFEKRPKGGAIFSRLVRTGEVFPAGFRIPFLDWSSQKYFSVAVNNSVLNYSFERLVTLDDGSDEFKLKFDLKYMVADPQKVAEGWEHDPLRKLHDEIARVITKNCARRKAEMFRSRFRELERIVLAGESGGLRAYAAALGLKIISIDLDKPPLPDIHRKVIQQAKEKPWEIRSHEIKEDVARANERVSRERERQREKETVDHKYDLQRLELRRQLELNGDLDEVHWEQQKRKLREIQTDAVGQALKNVGENINTAWDLREGAEVVREITGASQSSGPSSFATGLPSAAAAGFLPESGEDGLNSLLAQGIREIDKLKCPFAHKQALRSTLLHLVAEALLDDRADETLLKQYADKLYALGRDSQPPLNESQRLFLKKFVDVNELRSRLR